MRVSVQAHISSGHESLRATYQVLLVINMFLSLSSACYKYDFEFILTLIPEIPSN